MILEVLKITAVAAIGLAAFLYFYQDRMIFFPTGAPASLPRPATGAIEELVLRTDAGDRVVAWLVRTGEEPQQGAGTPVPPRPLRLPLLIYFGGNAEDVSWMIEMAARFAGHAVLLTNYRGYGPSEGRPGEQALFADALAWYDAAAARADVDPQRIAVMGRSLGSGVAVHLAASRKVSGVVLVSPYESLRSVAQSIYPFLPIGLLLKHRFDSLSGAPAIGAPLLCIAAQDDRVIPQSHSRRLFDAWGAPDKVWRVLEGDHNNLSDNKRYWDEMAAFLGRLGGPERRPPLL
jgi:hypothetical protein